MRIPELHAGSAVVVVVGGTQSIKKAMTRILTWQEDLLSCVAPATPIWINECTTLV